MSDAAPQQRRQSQGGQGAQRPSGPYNANLARFKRQNPGNGPHGFGGTYKKGEKGGLRPSRDGEEVIPLAERGLRRNHAAAQHPAAQDKAPAHKGSTSSTAIKSKIRDLTRLLKKPNLDPTVKKHKEHELALVQKALEDKQQENKAAAIDAKYKHIKFYERRKITRKLAGLQRTLATLYSKTGGDVMSAEEKQIRKDIAKWQLDADYVDVSRGLHLQTDVIKYYPAGEKYIGLFRSSSDSKDGADSDDEEAASASKKKKPAAAAASTSATPAAASADATAAAAAATLEAARTAIRKRVAQAKGVAVRKEREALGTVAPQKRKREDTTQDMLFQEAGDDEEETQTKSTKEAKSSSKSSTKPAAAVKEEEPEEAADDFMMSASDSEDEEEAEKEATPAPKPAAKAKEAKTEAAAEPKAKRSKKQ